LAPNDYALVVAAATAMRLLDRKVEAELWYRKVRLLIEKTLPKRTVF